MLTKCSECDHSMSEEALACPQCGHPNKPSQQVAVPASPASKLACPECGSENTAKFSVIYRNGTSNTTKSHKGSVMVGSAWGSTSGTTTELSSTHLAGECSPPEQKNTSRRFIIALLCLASSVITSGIGGIGFIGFTIYGVVGRIYNKKEWPVLYNYWQRKCKCMRCGHTFTL